MVKSAPVLDHLKALLAYAGIAVLFCYPGSFHIFTHYIGPGGDQSDTLWSLWYFRYALKVLHSNPLWTDHMYWPYGFNLIMHMYILFADLEAYFLIQPLGMVATYNVLLLSSLVLSGYATFLLARDFDLSWGACFLAGAVFAFCPAVFYVISSGDGLNYQVYFPISFFVWGLCRAIRSGGLCYALIAAIALTVEWTYSYYYFLFCCLLIPFFFFCLVRPVSLRVERRAAGAAGLLSALDLGAFCAFLLAGRSALRGQREFHGAGSFRELSLYVAPYLAFWLLLGLRLGLSYAVRLRWQLSRVTRRTLWPYAATLGLWAAINLPLIVAVWCSMRTGDYGTTPSSWRGGGNPTDVLALILPGAAHPIWGNALSRLYRFAGLNLGTANSTGLVVLAAAAWLWRQRVIDPWVKLWFAGFIFSFILTLGPWLKIWGIHTYLPMPFYFLHLLPVFNNMQHGFRFSAFVMLFGALLLAAAVDRLRALPARWSRWAPAAVFCMAALEYAPAPQTMYRMDVPGVIERLGPRPDGAMLPIPPGAVFNGLAGQGTLGTPWLDVGLQTIHHKPIFGGYLGRVSRRTYDAIRNDPCFEAMVLAQQGGRPVSCLADRALLSRYLRDMHIRYVLVEEKLISPRLRAALKRWPIKPIDKDQGLSLYTVVR